MSSISHSYWRMDLVGDIVLKWEGNETKLVKTCKVTSVNMRKTLLHLKPLRKIYYNTPTREVWISIADAAVTKCTNDWTKSWFFCTRKLAKLFSTKFCQVYDVFKTCAHIYNKRMLISQDCVRFHGHLTQQDFFLVNIFADFPDVAWVKKN